MLAMMMTPEARQKLKQMYAKYAALWSAEAATWAGLAVATAVDTFTMY
jgi:hypothetical protein